MHQNLTTEINPHSNVCTQLHQQYFVTCIFKDAFTWKCFWWNLLLVYGIWSGWDPVLGWELGPGAASRPINRGHSWHVIFSWTWQFLVQSSLMHALQAQPTCLWTCWTVQFRSYTFKLVLYINKSDFRLSQCFVGWWVCRYCIVVFAGIAAEALVYGDAEGGENDENLYKALISQLRPPWGPGKVGNVIS